ERAPGADQNDQAAGLPEHAARSPHAPGPGLVPHGGRARDRRPQGRRAGVQGQATAPVHRALIRARAMADGPVSAQDAMPVTRGLNYFLVDGAFQQLCESVMGAETYALARPHLIALGEVAGGELDALAHAADKNPPVLRSWDERGQRIDEVVFHPSYRRMEELAF